MVCEQPVGLTTWVPRKLSASTATDEIPVEQYPKTPVRISPFEMRSFRELHDARLIDSASVARGYHVG